MFHISAIDGTQTAYDPEYFRLLRLERSSLSAASQTVSSEGLSQAEELQANADQSSPVQVSDEDEFLPSESLLLGAGPTSLENADLAVQDASTSTPPGLGQVSTGQSPAIGLAAASLQPAQTSNRGSQQPDEIMAAPLIAAVPPPLPSSSAKQSDTQEPDVAAEHAHLTEYAVRSYLSHKSVTHQRQPALTAADIMSAPVQTLHIDQPLSAAWELFRSHRYRHVPIISAEEKLVGIVSDRNFIAAPDAGLPRNADSKSTIRDAMVTNVLTARPEASIRDVAEVMIEARIGALPIVANDESLVGILTRSDILRALVKRGPLELWT